MRKSYIVFKEIHSKSLITSQSPATLSDFSLLTAATAASHSPSLSTSGLSSVPLTFAHKVPVSLNSVHSRTPVSGGKYRHNQSPTIQLSSPSAPNFRGKPGRRQFTPNFRVPPPALGGESGALENCASSSSPN